MSTTKLTGRGGPGRNQGRHPKPKSEKIVKLAITLYPEMLEWLDNQPGKNRSQKLQNIIRERMNQDDIS